MANALRNIRATETYSIGEDDNEKHTQEIARVDEIDPRAKYGWMDEKNRPVTYVSINEAIAAFIVASIMVPIRALLDAWNCDIITDYIMSRMVPEMMSDRDFRLDTYLQRMGETAIDKADETPIGKLESTYRDLLKREHQLETAIAAYDDPTDTIHRVVETGISSVPYDFSDAANAYSRLYRMFPDMAYFRKAAKRHIYLITSAGYRHYVDMLIDVKQQLARIREDRYMVAAEMRTWTKKSNGTPVSRISGYKIIDTHTQDVYYIKTVKVGDMRIATRTYTYGALAKAFIEPVVTRYNHRVLDYVSYKFSIAPLKTTDTDIR